MNSVFKKALTTEEYQEMEEVFKTSSVFRKLFRKALKDKRDALVKEMISKSNFEEPAWSEKQANILGKIAMLDSVDSWV